MAVILLIVDPESSSRDHVHIHFVLRVRFQIPFVELYQEHIVGLSCYWLGGVGGKQHDLPRESRRIEFVAVYQTQKYQWDDFIEHFIII